MEDKVYLHYYSKVKKSLHADVEKEIEYAKGRIITKILDHDDVTLPNAKHSEIASKLSYLTAHVPNGVIVPGVQDIYEARYTVFKIPKKSGGYRTLHAPDEILKAYQRDVQKLLEKTCKMLPDNAVHSYVRHRNCKTALETHQKNHSRWFLKLDIKDFFDNITMDKMIAILNQTYPLYYYSDDALRDALDPCFLHNRLPQGSPASPVLSNIFLNQFDYKLKLELGKDFCYTRYADDILISSRKSFRFVEVVNKVKELLAPYELTIKDTKTRYGSCNGANWNLGLMYNQDLGITVGHRHKNVMKCMIHNLYTNREDTVEWRNKEAVLLGLLNYYKFIEPKYFNALIEKNKAKGYLQ